MSRLLGEQEGGRNVLEMMLFILNKDDKGSGGGVGLGEEVT